MRRLRFLRSMKFGLVLLSLIILLSLAGSVIPQGREAGFYQYTYEKLGEIIIILHLDNVFSSFYFIALLALLCINLIFCSILRVQNIAKQTHIIEALLQKTPIRSYPQSRESFEETLKSHGFRFKSSGKQNYCYKRFLGHWGSFLTHLSLLLILLLGGAMIYFSEVQDFHILPGESEILADSSVIYVDEFQIADEQGLPDYRTLIRVKDKHGALSEQVEMSVNNPFSFGGYTLYQQSYAIAGNIMITNNNQEQQLLLTEQVFLSPDGKNGFVYAGLQEIHKQLMYRLIRQENGQQSVFWGAVGDAFSICGMEVLLNEPVPYPGIRVKTSPPFMLESLYAAFLLMIVALYLCFFHVPVAFLLRDDGYALYVAKPEASPEFLIEFEKE